MTNEERREIVADLLRQGYKPADILEHLHRDKEDFITYFDLRQLIAELTEATRVATDHEPPSEPEAELPVASLIAAPEEISTPEPAAPAAEEELVSAATEPEPAPRPRAKRVRTHQPGFMHKAYRKLWGDRGWVGKAITLSVLLHAGLLVISGFIIIMRAQLKPQVQFVSPAAARPALEPHKLEMKVKVADLQKASARPRLAPRLLAARAADVTLPEIKKVPSAADQKVRKDFASIGASGLGAGIGGGFGSGIGGGRGGGMPLIMSARCDPAERMRRLMMNGGDPKCEQAVFNGLKWLSMHQNSDGSWGKTYPTAMTGLALLAFLGHCETPDSGTFAVHVGKAIRYLIQFSEKHGGRLYPSQRNQLSYEHAIATYAACEAYTLTREPQLRPVVEKAIGLIIKRQNSLGGWHYAYGGGNVDMSVTGWNIQALKAAHLTGLKINGLEGALDRAAACTKRMQHGSGEWMYQWDSKKVHPTLTGVGVFCLQMWKNEHSDEVRKGAKMLTQKSSYKDIYECYYNTMACFQRGGITWDKWNKMFQPKLLKSQNRDGSWPEGPRKLGADHGSYETALSVLSLEVYYRYLPSVR